MAKPPLLPKPLGLFIQLLGLLALIGISAEESFSIGSVIAGLLVGVPLLWIGRQTHPRADNGK